MTARKWVVIPACCVLVRIDDNAEVEIGYGSLREALEEQLMRVGLLARRDSQDGKQKIKVIERKQNGVAVAYAVSWDEYFREWSFVEIRHVPHREESDRERIDLGTCVEGMRVEFDSPGYTGKAVIAIANATGRHAPRTNVARSGLEATAEREALTRSIYGILLGHVTDEIKELQKRSFSLTWAVGEAHYLIGAIAPNTREVQLQEEQMFVQELAKLPALIVEKDGTRRAISAEDLSNAEYYWTVDSAFFASVEQMLREVPSNASLQAMAGALGGEHLSLPAGLLLCTRPAGWISKGLDGHEVAEIRIDRGQRRIDLRWVAQQSPHSWRRTNINALPPQYLRPLRNILDSRREMLFPKRGVSVSGAEGEFAVESCGITFLLPGTPLAEFLSELISRADVCVEDEYLLVAIADILEHYSGEHETRLLEVFDAAFPDLLAFHPKAQSAVDLEGLRGAIQQVKGSVFSTSLWQRS